MKSLNSKVVLSFMLPGIVLFSSIGDTRQFRRMEPIPVAPEVNERGAPGVIADVPSAQLMSVANLKPIDENVIRRALDDIVGRWNTQGLDEYLDEHFPQRFELLDMMNREIPTDAVLELISVQNISTTSQVWGNQTPPERSQISTVVATVSLQLRFNDPVKGLITLPHTSQFYLRVVETE